MDLPLLIYATLAALFGLAIGSFLNVVIHRMPLGESILRPGSRCPQCGDPIRALDNIPALSWLLLRGKCRACHAAIPIQYPLVELLTAALFVALVLRGGADAQSVLEAIFAAAMIALIFIDARHQILPDRITYPAMLFAVLAAAIMGAFGRAPGFELGFSLRFAGPPADFSPARAALIGGLLIAAAAPVLWLLDRLDPALFDRYLEWEEIEEDDLVAEEANARRSDRTIHAAMLLGLAAAVAWAALLLSAGPANAPRCEAAYDGLWRAFWGALFGGGAIWWMRTIYFFLRGAEGMGLGDVKMMCGIGAFLGWYGAFSVLLLSSILGAAIGLTLMLRAKGGMKTALPFGVCLGIAAVLVVLLR
jgi:leader peptidase (prepilin peptidase)/N-methyltransferase